MITVAANHVKARNKSKSEGGRTKDESATMKDEVKDEGRMKCEEIDRTRRRTFD
jgi:hypothetical protein